MFIGSLIKYIRQSEPKKASEYYADFSSLQKSTLKALSENIKDLEKFSVSELPEMTASQKKAMEGLQQLSENVKSMLK